MVNFSNVQELNTYLADKSYVTGFQASSADVEVHKSIGSAPDASKFPYASRWFNHIAAFSSAQVAKFPKGEVPAGSSSSSSSSEKKDEDFDLFGDEENDEEYEKQLAERAAAAVAAKAGAKKDKPVAKSSVLLDVKPWDDETDMKKMEECVRTIEIEGLVWGASKLVPVGYGIKKLQISCVVIDDLVSVDDLEERITAFEDHVQSVDIAAFNKI
eukprot:TRINITY_DN47_c0_g1_i5.p1 TRINITY_DN47_c0_g1~~TRINITY_DN47_c0_g1_i5.p1  ORF type:complete len:214 (-),score=96.30 TRINITY_DN47_c0_g1_i5:199-840(-)